MADKAPAFQFYPKDYLSDAHTRAMTFKQRGMYADLLCHCWLEGALPSDPAAISRILGIPTATRFVTNDWPVIRPCFRQSEAGWVHPRLDKEREKQDSYRRRQTDAAHMRWDSQRNAVAMPTQCSPSSSSSPSASAEEDQEQSSALPAATEPPVLTFPTNGKPSAWDLTSAQLTEWQALYSGLDVLAECRKALVWVKANQRKTAHGMPRFLVNWLNRATDRGGARQSTASGLTKQTLNALQASEEFLRANSDPDAA